jgi:DUF917 family protein
MQNLLPRRILSTNILSFRELGHDDLYNLVYGATVLSTGGGGSPSAALKTVDSIFRKGLKPKIIDPKDVKIRALVFCPSDVGGGISQEEKKRFEEIYKQKIPIEWDKWPIEEWSPASVRELAKYLGRRPDVYLTTELGPGAFVGVIQQAARDGKPMVDADTVGRAVPDATMSGLSLKKAKMLGGASTSHFGDVVIWKHVKNLRRLEDLARAFSTASGGGVGMATAYNWADVKRAVVCNSVSKCIDLGSKVRRSKDPEEALNAILGFTKGKILFRGKIAERTNDSRHGHLYGEYVISGLYEYTGHRFRIWFKNENHVGWKDDRPVVSSPDIITVYDPETRQGLWNWDKVPTDHEVYVLGIPCEPMWRSKQGVKLLGPRAFGYDFQYLPVEDVQT